MPRRPVLIQSFETRRLLRTVRILHRNRLLECLEALKNSDGLTRNQLADQLSLQPVTISLLVRRLVDAELAVGRFIHTGKVRGRPVTTFFINPAGLYFMGVHVDAKFISCGLIDLKMNQISHTIRPVRCENGLKAEIASIVRTAVFESQTPGHKIFGVGICISNDFASSLNAAGESALTIRSVSQEDTGDWKIQMYTREAANCAFVESEPPVLQIKPQSRPALNGSTGTVCFGAALLLQKSLFRNQNSRQA